MRLISSCLSRTPNTHIVQLYAEFLFHIVLCIVYDSSIPNRPLTVRYKVHQNSHESFLFILAIDWDT